MTQLNLKNVIQIKIKRRKIMRKYEYRIHTEFKQFDVIQEFDCEPNKVQDYIRRYINQNILWLSFEQSNQKVIYINPSKIIAFEVLDETSPTT